MTTSDDNKAEQDTRRRLLVLHIMLSLSSPVETQTIITNPKVGPTSSIYTEIISTPTQLLLTSPNVLRPPHSGPTGHWRWQRRCLSTSLSVLTPYVARLGPLLWFCPPPAYYLISCTNHLACVSSSTITTKNNKLSYQPLCPPPPPHPITSVSDIHYQCRRPSLYESHPLTPFRHHSRCINSHNQLCQRAFIKR